MTIYKYTFNQNTLKVNKTKYTNIEFFGNSSNLMNGVRTLCNENDLGVFKGQIMFSVYDNQEKEFLQMVISQKKRRLQELSNEYKKLSNSIKELERQGMEI